MDGPLPQKLPMDKNHKMQCIFLVKLSYFSSKTEILKKIVSLSTGLLIRERFCCQYPLINYFEEIIEIEDTNEESVCNNGDKIQFNGELRRKELEQNDESEDVKRWEPKEVTQIYTCPMCFKKYASLSDVETHISLFHRISRKVQRESMQGGKSMSIITKNL